MKKVLTKVMLVALMAILPLSMFAQKKQTKPVEKYFYIFAEGGLSVNHTDLANYGGPAFIQNGKFTIDDYFLKNYDGQVGLGYQFGKVMGINAKFGTATLAGEKHGQEVNAVDITAAPVTYANKGFRDAKFDKTTFMEGNLNLTFNFTNLFFGYNPRRVFNFIPHVGVGGIYYKAGEVTSTTDGSQFLAAKADHELALTVPVGAEINFNLGRMVDFFIDYTYNWMSKDDLDQVKKWPNDDIQIVNDMYSSINAGLRLKFNKKRDDINDMVPSQITMRTNPEQLEEKDGKVCFDVIFEIPGNYFQKDAVMNVTPTFNYDGGQIELEPVTFVGENVKGGDYQVNYKNGGTYTKPYCLDFVPETGMEKGKLVGNPMIYAYDGTIYPTQQDIMKNAYFVQGGDKVIANGIKYVAPVEPPVIDTTPPAPEKVYESVGKIFFDYNKSDYRANLKQNKNNVKSIIDEINSNEEYTDVLIKGWASPEGEVSLNNNLSSDRSKTAKDQVKVGDKVKITTEACGADWDGFYELLANSSIKDKDQIANVLRQIKDGNQRERELKNMMKVYPKLEKLLPELRRAEVFVKR
jgi:outer membrane protein OmpA-like peptidoglycan-associated protein